MVEMTPEERAEKARVENVQKLAETQRATEEARRKARQIAAAKDVNLIQQGPVRA